jgi:hypothetical protein
VDLHGGKIKVDSKLGEGTTVAVRLPIMNPESQAAGDWQTIDKRSKRPTEAPTAKGSVGRNRN